MDYGYYVDFSITPSRVQINEPVDLEARIVDKKSNCISVEGVEIVFETSFGNLYNDSKKEENCTKFITKTNKEGKAKAKIVSDKPGTALVTASSDKCLPEIKPVEFISTSKR